MKVTPVFHLPHLLTALLRWMYRRFFELFCGGMLLAFLLFSLWLWRGAHYLIVETEIAPSDVLLILGGKTDRLREGVKLYHQGYAPHVLFTAAGLQLRLAHVHLNWGQIMRHAAKIEGIPPEATFLDMESTSTYEDAVNSKRILQEHGWKSVIIISSTYHMRRVRMTFDKVFDGSGIRLHYHPAPSDELHPDGWWKREADMVYVVFEYIKLVMYWFKYF